MTTALVMRKAGTDDLEAIYSLLRETNLQTVGIQQHLEHFFVALMEGRIIGTIGLEMYGQTALLRSASVSPLFQHQGIGEALMSSLEHYAREHKVSKFILLTTTASHYFQRKGFTEIDRKMITGKILESAQFKDACPTTATVMEKQLTS